MAVNPRGGEGSSKGSRYIPERLVGPGVIEQNSYIDIAKAKLHMDSISVPSISSQAGGTAGATSELDLQAEPGDLVRVVNANMQTSSSNGAIEVSFTGFNVGNQLVVLANSAVILVIPPGATKIRILAGVTTGAAFRPGGDFAQIKLEWTVDN